MHWSLLRLLIKLTMEHKGNKNKTLNETTKERQERRGQCKRIMPSDGSSAPHLLPVHRHDLQSATAAGPAITGQDDGGRQRHDCDAASLQPASVQPVSVQPEREAAAPWLPVQLSLGCVHDASC